MLMPSESFPLYQNLATMIQIGTRHNPYLFDRRPVSFKVDSSEWLICDDKTLWVCAEYPLLYITNVWVTNNPDQGKTYVKVVFDDVGLKAFRNISFHFAMTSTTGVDYIQDVKNETIRYCDDSVFTVSFTFYRGISKVQSIVVDSVILSVLSDLFVSSGQFIAASDNDIERYTHYKRLRKRYMDPDKVDMSAKSPFKEKYKVDGWKHFPDAVQDAKRLRELMTALSVPTLSDESIAEAVAKPDNPTNEHIIFWFKCVFDSDCYRILYLLQQHRIVRKTIADNGFLTLGVSVDVSNETLIYLMSFLAGYEYPEISRESFLAGQVQQNDFVRQMSDILNGYQYTDCFRYSGFFNNEFFLFAKSFVTPNDAWHIIMPFCDKAIKDEHIRLPKWRREFMLYYWFKSIFDDAVFQYRAPWLEGQSLDIYIPSLKLGVEYQGRQHYEKVGFFGGDEEFELRMKEDQKKRLKCLEQGVSVIDWRYDEYFLIASLHRKLIEAGISSVPSVEELSRRLTEIKDDSVEHLLFLYQTLIGSGARHIQSSTGKNEPQYKLGQFSYDGKLVNTYTSYQEAAVSVGVSIGGIQKVLAGVQVTAGGFRWRKYSPSAVIEDIPPIPVQKVENEAKK